MGLEINIKHTGNCGDLIYSLPAMRQLSVNENKKISLFIWLDRKGVYYEGAEHPLGGVMFNQKMLDMAKPLLEYLPFIESVQAWDGEKIHVDFDNHRLMEIGMPYGHIPCWYFLAFPDLVCDLSEKTFMVPFNDTYKDMIIVNRTSRYRNPHISYHFLRNHKNVHFVGVLEEYDDFKREVPNAKYLKVDNFLQLAVVINSCKFFIGNQSMCFAIAENIKVKRILEVCSFAPNVIPQGANGYQYYHQSSFEYYVNKLDNG